MKQLRMFGLLLLLSALFLHGGEEQERVSSFGEYKGYGGEIYDGWLRFSQYVTMRDGVRLAVDYSRPTLNGKVVEKPLPVVWTHHRYHRAHHIEGKVRNLVDLNPNYQSIVKHGYVIALVDVRGGGASFGTHAHAFADVEALDAYDITEWLTKQPWSTGKVGMVGASYLGISQFFAASEAPKGLVTILPRKALIDMYDFTWTGGIFRDDFMRQWQNITRSLDTQVKPVPVDEDTDGSLLEAAVAQHADNGDVFKIYEQLPYRDSVSEDGALKSPLDRLEAINKSGVSVYQWAGWFDTWPKDATIMHNNLTAPRRMVIGAWFHQTGQEHALFAAEHVRWLDYWLKGVDNGIMDEDPVHYEVIDAPAEKAWRSAKTWPPEGTKKETFYLAGNRLTTTAAEHGRDAYTIDYTTTSGKPSRWSNAYGAGGFEVKLANMADNDAKGLSYTSEPLKADVEVIGHPVIHLWLQTAAEDVDVYVYLNDVAPDGFSHYVTEGQLRASHRKTTKPKHNYLGLPYHPSRKGDVQKLDGKPVMLSFDLHPIAKRFRKGHRIRVTITGADKDNSEVREVSPAPEIFLVRDGQAASNIILPIMK